MSERLKFQGRLVEKEQELKGLNLKLQSYFDSLRDHLDPFERIENLNGELIAAEGIEFAAIQVQYKECMAEIAAIKKALGR